MLVTGIAAFAVVQAENSDVSPPGLVAVAVTACPAEIPVPVTCAVPLPEALVVIVADPMNVAPSPLPDPSQVGLANTSTSKVDEAVLFRVTGTRAEPPVSTNAFVHHREVLPPVRTAVRIAHVVGAHPIEAEVDPEAGR